MRKMIVLYCVFYVMLSCVTGCTKNNAPLEVIKVYESCMNAAKKGEYPEFARYLHFEDERYAALTQENFAPILDYSVKSWEQMSKDLWAVEVVIRENDGLESICYHFVGVIDGELRVMFGVHNIPSNIKGDGDFSKYEHPDAIYIDDLIR